MISQISGFYKPGITVLRNAPTPNSIGGSKENWTDHLEILGLIRPISGSEPNIAEKPTLNATHRLYCEVCDITEKDRVEGSDGTIYRVIFVSNVMDMSNHLQVDMILVR